MTGRSTARGRGRARKEFAVIGLGRFGGSLARRLEELGHTVLGVDVDMVRVQEFTDQITSAESSFSLACLQSIIRER